MCSKHLYLNDLKMSVAFLFLGGLSLAGVVPRKKSGSCARKCDGLYAADAASARSLREELPWVFWYARSTKPMPSSTVFLFFMPVFLYALYLSSLNYQLKSFRYRMLFVIMNPCLACNLQSLVRIYFHQIPGEDMVLPSAGKGST